MKRLLITVLFAILPALVHAEVKFNYDSHGVLIPQEAPIDIFDKDSVKRGAKSFADYCMSCHSAFFMRYNRIAKDTGMSDEEVREMMIFTRDRKGEKTKVGDLMKVSMTEDYAKNAFGGSKVPDLSLTARSRGANWLYTYLRTFYVDAYRPSGMNNVQFSDVAMPHVLQSLQGTQRAIYKEKKIDDTVVEYIDRLETIRPGSMTVKEYDAFVTDLVNFMVYLAEPVQTERINLGWKVLLFLIFFFVFAYMLKKEYWKDVH